MKKNNFLTSMGVFILVLVGHSYTYGQIFNPNVCFMNGLSILNGETVTGYQYDEVTYGTNCNTVKENFTCVQGVLVGNNPTHNPVNYPYSSCSVNGPLPCALGPQYGQQTVVQHGQLVTGYVDNIVEPGLLCDTIGPAGNVGVLQCNNGVFTSASRWIVNPNTYQHPNCEVRDLNDCEFNGQLVQHGYSVTGYFAPSPAIGGQCAAQIRSCNDGTLNGSFQFSTCTETQAVCGAASGVVHSTTPQVNLCAQGYLLGSVGVNPSTSKRQWSCGGYGLSVVSCEASAPAVATGTAQCGIFTGYVQYLTGNMSSLCYPQATTGTGTSAYATGFTTTARGWRWQCLYNNTITNTCNATNNVLPTATVVYSTTHNTSGSVTATLTNIQPAGTTIFNNNGSGSYTFGNNGSFNFMLNLDGKIGIIKAEVDRISRRTNIFQDILETYEDELCDDFDVDLQDAYGSIYHTAVRTMQNNCIMRGYNVGNKNVFLVNKPLSVMEAIVTLKKSMEKLGDYDYIVEEPTGYKYYGIPASHKSYEYVKRAEDVNLLKFIKQKKTGNTIYIEWDRAITQTELKKMLDYTLFIHFFHDELIERYYNELDFASKTTVTRGEHARILDKILASYPHIPVGNDYRLLKLVYEMIKNDTIDNQIRKLVKINKVLTKMPQPMFTNYGLSKRRLITDVQAVINNRYPKRNEKKDVTIDMVRSRIRLAGQPENVVSIENMNDYLSDNYDDFDPLGR